MYRLFCCRTFLLSPTGQAYEEGRRAGFDATESGKEAVFGAADTGGWVLRLLLWVMAACGCQVRAAWKSSRSSAAHRQPASAVLIPPGMLPAA
jgi:hypothetical protein